MTARPGSAAGSAPGDVQRVARRVAQVIRRIIGAPDYEGYLVHLREHHPDRTPLTEDEFRQDRLRARYSQPGNRCC